MSTTPPEQRIREHLERRGRPSNVELRRLLGTWRITDPTPEDRVRVVAALESAGLVVDPDITDTPLDAHVVVSIADAGTLARRARMREAAASDRIAQDSAAAREAEAQRAREAEAQRAREAEAQRAREAEAQRAREAERAREEEGRRTREAERARAEEARATAIADEARRRAEREDERRRARERDERERIAEPRGEEAAAAAGGRVWMEGAFDERPATEGATLADLDPDLDDPVDEEPAEIPESFPRSLLTAGAAFLAIALLLPWFKGRRGGIEVDGLDNAWEWLGVLDVLIVLLILGASAIVLLRPPSPTPARVVALAAIVTLISVAYRIGAPPDDIIPGLILEVDLQIGPFVALIGCALVVCGAGLLARTEELPFFAERGERPPRRETGDDGARTASD
jgi:hypothetical protein